MPRLSAITRWLNPVAIMARSARTRRRRATSSSRRASRYSAISVIRTSYLSAEEGQRLEEGTYAAEGVMFGIEIRNAQADQFKTMVIRSSINALAFFGPRRYLDGCPVDHPGRNVAARRPRWSSSTSVCSKNRWARTTPHPGTPTRTKCAVRGRKAVAVGVCERFSVPRFKSTPALGLRFRRSRAGFRSGDSVLVQDIVDACLQASWN